MSELIQHLVYLLEGALGCEESLHCQYRKCIISMVHLMVGGMPAELAYREERKRAVKEVKIEKA